jgi:hypothetical protein
MVKICLCSSRWRSLCNLGRGVMKQELNGSCGGDGGGDGHVDRVL